MKKIYAVVTAFGALLVSTVIIGRAEPQESRSSGEEPIAQAEQAQAEHARESHTQTRELLDRIVSTARATTAKLEEADREKGYVKYGNGNWGPPLPPGVFMKEPVFPQPLFAKRGPGHRGNQLTYLDTVTLRPAAVVDALTSSKAPTERLQYFRGLIEHPDFQLDGWHLCVRKLSAVDGVNRVTIYATPLVSSDVVGPVITVVSALEETYELRDGKLKLVETAPFGSAPVMGMIGM